MSLKGSTGQSTAGGRTAAQSFQVALLQPVSRHRSDQVHRHALTSVIQLVEVRPVEPYRAVSTLQCKPLDWTRYPAERPSQDFTARWRARSTQHLTAVTNNMSIWVSYMYTLPRIRRLVWYC